MKKLISIIFVILICTGASAQSIRTLYFLDHNTYSYRINPAAAPERSFIGLAIGNIELQNRSSIGVSSFLFPEGNTLVTGLNSAVDANTFLSGLNKASGVFLEQDLNIISFGIAKANHSSTVELNIRASEGASLPYDLFAFLKKGGINTSYNIGSIYANVNAFADLAYGYSRKINDQLSVGARVHALVGLAQADARGNNTSISMSGQEIILNADFDMSVAGPVNLTITDGSVNTDEMSFEPGNFPGGFGAALDFGAIYEPIDGLEVSFSVNDFGGISWKNSLAAKADGITSFKGGNISFEDGEITTDFENILEEIVESVEFKDMGQASRFMFLPMTIAAGARYRMPFYKGLSTGVLASFHTGKYTSWYDVRLGATITPARIISATANVGISSFSPTFGAALNINLGPLNLMAGIDSYLGKTVTIASVNVPRDKFQENIHLGMAITF